MTGLDNALLLCATPQLLSLPQEDEDVQLERRGDLLAPLKVRLLSAAQSIWIATAPALTAEQFFRSTSGPGKFGQLFWQSLLAWPSLRFMVAMHQTQWLHMAMVSHWAF